MRTFADFKRRLVPGLVLKAVNHMRPEASGERTIVKVQGNGYWFNIAGKVYAADHRPTELAGKPCRYWYEWRGGAKIIRIDGPNEVTLLTEPGDGPQRPLVTLTFPEAT